MQGTCLAKVVDERQVWVRDIRPELSLSIGIGQHADKRNYGCQRLSCGGRCTMQQSATKDALGMGKAR